MHDSSDGLFISLVTALEMIVYQFASLLLILLLKDDAMDDSDVPTDHV